MTDYGAACGPGCGWCGRCTPYYDRPNARGPEPIDICPICKQIVERVSVAVPIDDHTVLVCCSERCAANLEATLDERE